MENDKQRGPRQQMEAPPPTFFALSRRTRAAHQSRPEREREREREHLSVIAAFQGKRARAPAAIGSGGGRTLCKVVLPLEAKNECKRQNCY